MRGLDSASRFGRYAVGNVRRFARYANYWGREANRRYYRLRGPPDGYDLPEEDWDTAIILDACRHDVFAECHSFDGGTLRRETAPGSTSVEFMRRSFGGGRYHDTVYVTSNYFVTLLEEDTFHAVTIEDTWDPDDFHPDPEIVTEQARIAHEEYPNKRIVVHYMQPHLPICHPEYEYVNDRLRQWKNQYWPEGISIGELRDAYRANVEYVLRYVEELVAAIDGRVVVTADHGELLGDRLRPIPVRGFDHNPELYVDALLEVPWFEIETGPRRDIRADPPPEKLSVDEEETQRRLEALGYV